ncbi:MAG: PfkB family carbohydrate kinase [Promethearchaeota archaeon]
MRNKINKIFSILFIGHFSKDSIIKNNIQYEPTIGGSISFGSLSLKTYARKINVRIVSNCGNKNFSPSLLDLLRKKEIDLKGIKWFNTENTSFILEYFSNSRTLTLKSKSPNLNFLDIPESYLHNPPDAIIIAPLCNEVSGDYIETILKQFPDALIGIDLQGFIRKFNEKGEVFYASDKDLINYIYKIIDLVGERLILKGSEIEMKLLAGNGDDLNKIMSKFDNSKLKGLFIMTLGEAGSMLIKSRKKILKIPAFKPKVVKDETGAGDVYLAIFIYEYLNSDKTWPSVKKCALLASSAASFLVEEIGPSGIKKKKKVLYRLNKKNYIKRGNLNSY